MKIYDSQPFSYDNNANKVNYSVGNYWKMSNFKKGKKRLFKSVKKNFF